MANDSLKIVKERQVAMYCGLHIQHKQKFD